jgi:4-amino-4-deoxy-L-arabinose transferase-like glycosyltransferase
MKIASYLKSYVVFDIILIVVAYFTLFDRLDKWPITNWDEGVYATNALEMSLNGNFLVKYYEGKPEMWGTEPPLAAWIDVASIKIFGYNEFAIRLPSAIAALFVIIIILNFCTKELKNRVLGYFSALVLLSTQGYVKFHVSRTADLDSFLVLFDLIYIINFYKYLKYSKPKYFYFAAIGVILAFFTKSIAGLLLLPGLLLYAIYQKKIKFVFGNKELYIGIFLFLCLTCLYYFLRERVNPGYIKMAWNNEIASRYFVINTGHEGPFTYYYDLLMQYQFFPWILLIPLTILFSTLRKEFADVGILKFFGIVVFSFWLILSFSKTKIDWYGAPMLPFLAITAGFLLSEIYELLYKSLNTGKLGTYVFSILFIISVFYFPIKTVRDSNAGVNIGLDYGLLMKQAKDQYPQYKSYKVLVSYISPSATYYCQYLNLLHHFNTRTSFYYKKFDINIGDTILFSDGAVRQKLNDDYYYTVVSNYYDASLVKVDSLKRK